MDSNVRKRAKKDGEKREIERLNDNTEREKVTVRKIDGEITKKSVCEW